MKCEMEEVNAHITLICFIAFVVQNVFDECPITASSLYYTQRSSLLPQFRSSLFSSVPVTISRSMTLRISLDLAVLFSSNLHEIERIGVLVSPLFGIPERSSSVHRSSRYLSHTLLSHIKSSTTIPPWRWLCVLPPTEYFIFAKFKCSRNRFSRIHICLSPA